MIIGICAGVVSGLIGIGGGIVMVPAMVYFLGMSQHKAQGTSLFVIIPTAVLGALVYFGYGHLDIGIALLVSIGGISGAYLGSFFAGKLTERNLKIIYAIFLLIVGTRMIF